MPQSTDLNVAPYYDDFDKDKNFVRTLFRPGFAIQARELTQLQSTLQNQIEQGFSHMFKEGTVVIPGSPNFMGGINAHMYVRIQSTFGGETIDPQQYVNADNPVILTGATSGVKFMVSAASAATTTDPVTLYGQVISSTLSGKLTDVSRKGGLDAAGNDRFVIDENISANVVVKHGSTTFAIDAPSMTTLSTEGTITPQRVDQSGSLTETAGSISSEPFKRTGIMVSSNAVLASISAGIYFVRGTFVAVEDQTIVLNKYGEEFSGRIGLRITETIVTPEADTTLLDNAQGSANFAAKGAHRLKFTLTLISLSTDSTDDKDFIELMRVKKNVLVKFARDTEYSILEETLARRTFDESGNYTVRPFTFQVKESVDASVKDVNYTGVFNVGQITDSGNTASESLLALQVSTGKAYVKGFEIEKIAPTIIDLPKARDFETINASSTAFDVGNFVTVTNMFGTPDVSFVAGESVAFEELQLYDTITSTPGTAAGTMIGAARVRTYQHFSGTAGQSDAIYKLFLFDIRPFTRIKLSATPSPTITSVSSNGGQLITGVDSGATGFVFGAESSSDNLVLTNVIGTFQVGEKLISSDSAETGGILENVSNADLTILSVKNKTFEQVRSVFGEDPDSGQDFTADIALTSIATAASFVNLEGTDAAGSDNGDNILTEQDGEPISLNIAASSGTGSIRSICKLQDAEKNISLFRLAKRPVKTLLTATNDQESDTAFTIRKQFIATTNSSGAVTLSAGANEVFLSHSETDYTISVLTAGTGTTKAGDIVSASTGFSGGGTGTLTITNLTEFGTGAKLKIMTTISKTSVVEKTKTTKLMKQVKVVPGATAAYGTRPTDRTISLGHADVFRLMAVFESAASDTDAVAPTISLSEITGAFLRGEKITGSISGATARIITTSTPLSIVYTSGEGRTEASGVPRRFVSNDIITAESSDATGTVSAVSVGDSIITNQFLLDTGQRDNYYDIARIQRKPGIAPPTGRLLCVFDYLEHSAGDIITVDSYSDVANQMDYVDIPEYSATKVDPESSSPTGNYQLYNIMDFRPCVESAAGTSSSVSTVDQITGYSFDFFHRQYDGTGASANNFLKPGSLVQADYEYYLPKRAILDIDQNGVFSLTEGDSAETPENPEIRDNAMKLAEIFVPAFTFTPKDVVIRREKNQRFTMRDIGKLQDRISNLEYYTHLSLLERDAESFEIQDANGLNRFKSGFVVDAFQGHRLGDVKHRDYKCSIDMENNELRPASKTKAFQLIEQVVTQATTGVSAEANPPIVQELPDATTVDANRASFGYQKTGDLITLPYEEVVMVEQLYATRTERVTPVLVSYWAGTLALDPFSDDWFETEIAPDLIINVEGNFDTFFEANKDAIGTVWNAWQTQWSGTVSSSSTSSWAGNNLITRTVSNVRTDQTRTGIQTDVIERIDYESQGMKVIARALLPFCRPKTINFEGARYLPNTQVYPFFDRQDVSAFTKPTDGFSTSDASLIFGDALITNASGRIKGTFNLPDAKIAGNPKFATGEVNFRLTSSPTNITSVDPITAGEATYFATGILETEQEQIIATRNAEIRRTNLRDSTSIFSSANSTSIQRFNPPSQFDDVDDGDDDDDDDDDGGGGDPLAQTFMVEEPGGAFLSSIDIFFQQKDETFPVSLEVRNVLNGYPGPKILPFGRVVKDPIDIGISDTANLATQFVFPSPVYLQPNTEYCFCLLADVPTHKVWIARMGETELQSTLATSEVGGTATAASNELFAERTVSKQPGVGVMFKSHNNRTWAPSLMEDIKFRLNRCSFTANTGVVPLVNGQLPVPDRGYWDLGNPSPPGDNTILGTAPEQGFGENKEGNISSVSLPENPLIFTDGSKVIQVIHPNHNMNTTNNNVRFGDIKSGANTTIVNAIGRGDTTIVLADATNFNNTTGKYARLSNDGGLLGAEGKQISVENHWLIKIQNETILYSEISVSGTVGTITNAIRGFGSVTSQASPTGGITHPAGAPVELYQLHKIPFTSLNHYSQNITNNKGANRTHEAIGNITIDGYTIEIETPAYIDGTGVTRAQVGGPDVFATENMLYDVAQFNVSNMQVTGTKISAKKQGTSARSPAGNQTAFVKTSAGNSIPVTLNENVYYDSPFMIASQINENEELGGEKSLTLTLTMTSGRENISPVIDTARMTGFAISNRINNVDSASDVYPTSEYVASTEPEGDNNVAIYITRKVSLAQPATAMKVFFSANRDTDSEIKVLYKILRTDDASDFDELGWRYFNTDGSPDVVTNASLGRDDFQEYLFTSGVTDDGLGDPLDSFISFAIKIVMQSTNSSEPPRIKDFRSIALAT